MKQTIAILLCFGCSGASSEPPQNTATASPPAEPEPKQPMKQTIAILLCFGCSGASSEPPQNTATASPPAEPEPKQPRVSRADPDQRHQAIELVNLGVEAFNAGDIEKAEGKLRAAIERDPSLAAGHSNLAQVLMATGRNDDALEPLASAIRLEPDEPGHRVHRGRALSRLGRHHQAIAELERLVSHPAAYPLLGRSYRAVGKYQEAARAFSRACGATPAVPGPCLELARLYDRWHRFAEARAVLEVVLVNVSQTGAKARALHDLGVVLDRLGEPANAIAALSQAIALKPGDALARAQRGFIYARLGDRDRAVADLEALVKSGKGTTFLVSAANSKLAQLKQIRRSKSARAPGRVPLRAKRLPPVPTLSQPASSAGRLGVRQLLIEREAHLDSEVTVVGVVVWKYDCAKALSRPGRTRREVARLIRERPELCHRPHFILGSKRGANPQRGLRVVDVPRPPRPDEKKHLPREEIDNWPEVPKIRVGDRVEVAGTFALRSPKGFHSSDGLLVYKSIASAD